MKCKIVLFVEGRSELIFVYYLLFHIFPPDDLIIKPYELQTSDNFGKSIVPEHCGQHPQIEFFILNVNGGELVLAKIKEGAINWLSKKYDYVCGLKDMFSQTYDQSAKGKIDLNVTKKILNNSQAVINSLNQKSKVFIFFAVMELEAWYLGFTKTLCKIGLSETKINPILQPKYKKNITEIDPELLFYKPKTLLKEIYKQVNNKNYDEVGFAYQIGKNIDLSDFSNLYTTNKLSHFRKFYDFLKTIK